MTILRFLIIVLFGVICLKSLGQDKDQENETGGNDEFVVIYSDSLFAKDSIQFKIDRGTYHSSESFFDTLKDKAASNYIARKLYDFLVVENDNELNGNRKIDDYSNPFEQHSGKPIRKIYLRQLDVFGVLGQDSVLQTDQWYKDVGNWIHIPTHKSIIRENLLFSRGDTVDPSLLSDNGRILRNLQYIKDARFVVRPLKGKGDSVDIVVLTQDLWAKGFDVNLQSINAGEIQLFDNNFFGLGHKIQGNLIFDYFKNSNPGIETFYSLNNIRGSFINGKIYYLDAFDTHRYGLRLKRDFYSYQTRMAGGVSVFKTNTRRNIVQEDTTFRQAKLDYINHDFWLGYAFPFEGNNDIFKNRNRFILSARYKNDRFFEGPLITKRYNYRFHDNQMIMGKLSLSRQNFYKSSLIYGFGRTEDIPVGDLAAYTFGWEMDQFFRRFYSGINLRHGQFINDFGYLSLGLEAGGFIYNRRIEQGVIRLKSNYISKLFTKDNLKVRQFFSLDYARGFNRFPEETLDFNKYNDIRGFPNQPLYGNKKLVFKAETVGFTNVYYYGFRLALYGFCDLGFLGPKDKFVLNNRVKSGVGLGLRLRNENFVFNTFQIRLGYYPSLSPRSSFLVNLSGEKSLRPIDYTPEPPHVVDF
jgi:hypothetical protein